ARCASHHARSSRGRRSSAVIDDRRSLDCVSERTLGPGGGGGLWGLRRRGGRARAYGKKYRRVGAAVLAGPQGGAGRARSRGVGAEVALADAGDRADVDAAAIERRSDPHDDVVLESEPPRGGGGLEATFGGRSGDDLPAQGARGGLALREGAIGRHGE